MLISLTWLDELAGTPTSPDDPLRAGDGAAVAAALTRVGFEVEGHAEHGRGLETVIVGEVRSIEAHPASAKLHVVQLFDGRDVLTVVCGAQNLPSPGPTAKVAFAPIGTTLPGGLTLAAREVRGVASQGMICSEVELELGPDGDGILVLPGDWAAGERLVDRIPGARDVVLDVAIGPHRPDALGHRGLARELGLALGRRPPLELEADLDARFDALLKALLAAPQEGAPLVTLASPAACGAYLGVALDGVDCGPAPLPLRVRLHRVGLRPRNLPVDVTNLVLAEEAQPLHAFDRDQLHEGRVLIRGANADESLHTLDDRTLTLTAGAEGDLVIADAARPQALAGVLGGKDSGVREATRRILLEAAWFEPVGIRRSARRHGLHTDASHRFERQVDYGVGLRRAAVRAVELLIQHGRGQLVAAQQVRGNTPSPATIRFPPSRVADLLGLAVPETTTASILRGLGVVVDDADPVEWRCTAPTWRPDLERDVDLVEEVMRHHGLESLPSTAVVPSTWPTPVPRDPVLEAADRVLDAAIAQGYHEHVGLAFADPETLRLVDPDEVSWVRIANPMRSTQSLLRSALLPGVLGVLAANVARHTGAVRLVEVGATYRWRARAGDPAATAAIDQTLPVERWQAVLVRFDSTGGASGSTTADSAHPASESARPLVSDVLSLLRRVGLDVDLVTPDAAASSGGAAADSGPGNVAWLHPRQQVVLRLRTDTGALGTAGLLGRDASPGPIVGAVGVLHPDLRRAFDLGSRTAQVAWIDVEALPPPPNAHARPLPAHPGTTRDVSLDLPAEVSAQRVIDALEAAAVDACRTATVGAPAPHPPDGSRRCFVAVERWIGEGVASGRQALLVRVGYRAHDRSVVDAEVQSLHAAIVDGACDRLRKLGITVSVR